MCSDRQRRAEECAGPPRAARPTLQAAVCFFLLAAWSQPTEVSRKEPLPRELQGVGVTEHLSAAVPRDLAFTDSEGKPVTLGQFFDGRRAVILTMNYSNCPMLCSLQLNGLVEGLQRLDWNLGDTFQVVTVSIDPAETTQRAAESKAKYLKIYDRPGVESGWHWLTGPEKNIRLLADTIGFGYVYLPEKKQYAHEAALMICTPDGRVSRYLGGILYDAPTLRLALTEAGEGKIGSAMDLVRLYCFHYDAEAGRYAPSAIKIMRAGGVLMICFVAGLIGVLWRRGRRKMKELGDAG